MFRSKKFAKRSNSLSLNSIFTAKSVSILLVVSSSTVLLVRFSFSAGPEFSKKGFYFVDWDWVS